MKHDLMRSTAIGLIGAIGVGIAYPWRPDILHLHPQGNTIPVQPISSVHQSSGTATPSTSSAIQWISEKPIG